MRENVKRIKRKISTDDCALELNLKRNDAIFI